MPFVPRRGFLAITAVLDIAQGAARRPLSARALAEHYRLAPRHLEPILQTLVHVGVLKGIRGPRGGYELGRPASEVTLAEILKATLRPDQDDPVPLGESRLISEVVTPALELAEHAVTAALEGITVETLLQQAQGRGLRGIGCASP